MTFKPHCTNVFQDQELKTALPQQAKILLGLAWVTSHLTSPTTNQTLTGVTVCH